MYLHSIYPSCYNQKRWHIRSKMNTCGDIMRISILLTIFLASLTSASETISTSSSSTDSIPVADNIRPDSLSADSVMNDSSATDKLSLFEQITTKPEITAPPEFKIESSQFIDFLASSLTTQNGDLVFEGNFIVLGKAVYGHFEFILEGDSGSVGNTITTDDRAYRSDKGGRVKKIQQYLGVSDGCSVVRVLFHEMRVAPDKDAYISR